MTLHELLEHAVLDAYGLLDEEQRLAFERAFRAAPRSVQLQVRREQERVAGFESSLSSESPAPELKERVIAAVRAEIEAERANSELAALALHGGDLSGQVEAMGRRYVSGWWQTAAIALLAVSTVLGTIVGFNFKADETRIRESVVNLLNERKVPNVGQTTSAFLAGSEFDRIVLTPAVDTNAIAQGLTACAWIPASGSGYVALQAEKAPQVSFVIRMTNAQGRVVSTIPFTMSSRLELREIALDQWDDVSVEIAMIDAQGIETLIFTSRKA